VLLLSIDGIPRCAKLSAKSDEGTKFIKERPANSRLLLRLPYAFGGGPKGIRI